MSRIRKKVYGNHPIRDWMEGQKWYWFTINLSFNVFPWHWTTELTHYKWGLDLKFGPFGILILWQ